MNVVLVEAFWYASLVLKKLYIDWYTQFLLLKKLWDQVFEKKTELFYTLLYCHFICNWREIRVLVVMVCFILFLLLMTEVWNNFVSCHCVYVVVVVVVIVCFILFLLLMTEVWNKFTSKLTSTRVQSRIENYEKRIFWPQTASQRWVC